MRREDRGLFLASIMAIIWLVIAFIGYIYIHKSFSATELFGILQAIWQILVVMTILSLAGGIGALTPLKNLDVPPITRAVLTCAFGLGFISIAVLLVGATIGINAFLWVLILVGIILLRNQILLWWNYWQDIRNVYQEAGKLGRTIIIFVAIILACQLVIALAPPLWFDTLNYHLAIPQELIQLGRIVYIPNNMEWGNARQIDILYIPAMLIGGAETATVLGWMTGVMTLLAFADFTGKIFNRDSAWVAVASLMCAPSLTGLLASGYVDWEAMLFGLAMLICLLEWVTKGNRPMLYVAGLFAGMAFATKYTAAIAFISGAIIILFFERPFSLKNTVRNLAWFGCLALAMALPWLMKNFLATFNPFYPLFIPGGAMDAARLSLYQRAPLQDWSRLVLLPWQTTVWGIEGGYGFGASIGPLLLGLSPLALIQRQIYTPLQQRILAIGGTILLTTFLVWAIGSQFSNNLMETRYYFPNFTVWALLCGAGYFTISQIKLQGVRIQKLFAVLILLALGFNVFGTVNTFLTYNPLSVVFRLESRETYIQNTLGAYEVAMQAIKALPENARVLMLWEARGFECLPKCDSDEVIDRWYLDWSTYHNPDNIISAWKEQGYTHIILNRAGVNFLRENDAHAPGVRNEFWDGLNLTLSSLPLFKSIGGVYDIYSLP